MSHHEADQTLPEPRRKEIFLALVDAQDHEMTVAQSRKAVAERFGVSDSQIRQIEREGMDQQWPPL
jgi:DNA-directed RNA polymerase sigma subunit (sigma70/sigma32)